MLSSSAVNAFRQILKQTIKDEGKDEGLTLWYQAGRKLALTAETSINTA
jgi:hypothetical protein